MLQIVSEKKQKIIFAEDGENINDEVKKFNLLDNDKRYSKEKGECIDFVGFVIDDSKLLAVFPKHFFQNVDRTKITLAEKEDYIRLLFNVIKKYNIDCQSNRIASKYIGAEANFESDYPFEAFYRTYEYYQKYGLYKEDEEKLVPYVNGKISWKKTIQKSNIIVSDGNLIFVPIYSKTKKYNEVFISECMRFVINYTIEKFRYFIDIPPINGTKYKMDFIDNKEYVLRKLYQYKMSIFKDHQKKLVQSLIEFFEQYNSIKTGGAIHFKINYFNLIWERMVNEYLNNYFIGVDTEKHKLLFNEKVNINKMNFKKEKFYIDRSNNKFFIEPDHYYSNGNKIYLFDSKYYEQIDGLNYKQFAYTILLGNSKTESNKELHSALILPGENNTELHLDLVEKYCQANLGCNQIIQQFLSVKLLMRNYLNK